MDTRHLPIALNKVFFIFFLFALSCSSEKDVVEYNRNILSFQEQSAISCKIECDSTFFLKSIDVLDFEDRKYKLNNICNEYEELEKSINILQANAYLYYNGSFKSAQGLIHLLSFSGHSGDAIGKTEGYLLFQGINKSFLIKVFSSQPEKEMLKSYFRDSYILITKSFNDGYDIPNTERWRIEYVIVEIDGKELKIVGEEKSPYLLREKFADVAF